MAPRRVGDDDGVGSGERLQARGEIGRLADYRLLLRRPGAEQVADDDEPGGDAEPHLEALGNLEPADGVDDGETRTHRLLGILLVRLRIAEIGEDAVAHVLGDKPAEPGQHLGDAAVISADDLAQIFGVEARRDLGRADQIAEHDGQQASLGAGFRRCGRRGRFRRDTCRRGVAQGGDRREQLAAMADRGDAEAGQVVGRQLGQDVAVDVVVAKGGRVLFEPEAPQPIGDVYRHILFIP